MKTLFTASMTSEFGGREGKATSPDGSLSLDMSMPASLGGTGKGTNPEELFAAGYSACFANAALLIAKQQKLELGDIPVTAEVSLNMLDNGGYGLGVTLTARVNLPQQEAEALIAKAHEICPYSNAVRGNIDVAIQVVGQ